jgi:DNA mismatch endonuclease (patch repair protein)
MDNLTPERRSANMSNIRSRDTRPEMIVRRLVHGLGYRYRLHVASLPGKPDIVLPRLKAIIDVRGCFWHQHPGCIDSHIPNSRIGYWRPKLERNQLRDRRNQRAVRKLGWRILVVWECQVKALPKLSKRILEFLTAQQ